MSLLHTVTVKFITVLIVLQLPCFSYYMHADVVDNQDQEMVETTQEISENQDPKNNDNHDDQLADDEEWDDESAADVDIVLNDESLEGADGVDSATSHNLIVHSIKISGNTIVPDDAILDRVALKIGHPFDPLKTRTIINNLYYDLKRFRNIQVYASLYGKNGVDIHIVVEEKKALKDVVFKNNKQITEKEIREKIDFSKVPAVDKEELKKYVLAITRIYRDKGYNKTFVTSDIELDSDDNATVVFSMDEHPRSIVKKIEFTGNKALNAKELRKVLFSKEDWLLGFMDNSGTYQEERIDADRHMIEQAYQDHGYINAKVVDTKTNIDPDTQCVTIVHDIEEGDLFTVGEVKVSGNNILDEDRVRNALPLKSGETYSREAIVDCIRSLEFIWGDFGYAYAHIEPSINPDETRKIVDITFFSEIGSPVLLNRLNIIGNNKTKDKIIRRKIALEEGSLISRRAMEGTKNRILALGFFDQKDGVNWKMTRLSENLADLDLVVKEVKTGSAHLQLSFGGTPQNIKSPARGVGVEAVVKDTNLFGSGIHFDLTGRLGADEKTFLFNLTQPWMFDKPIYGAFDLYHKRVAYNELRLTNPVNEKHTGGAITFGLATGVRHPFFNDTFFRFGGSIDDIRYEGAKDQAGKTMLPRATISGLPTMQENFDAANAYNVLLSKIFDPGVFGSWNFNMGKDAKNHPMHPTMGYAWLFKALAAYPVFNSKIGFAKADLDVHWYTPLIGDYDLILHAHGYFGWVQPIHHRNIPYRELFHIGGQASVRGFGFGQIGPQFTIESNEAFVNDSIGGGRTFFINVEFIFPVMADFSIKGLFFYDGGAGWHNPYACDVPSRYITGNKFDYRHSVGIGVRMLNPMPIRIDWGFKLDPRDRELGNEVHFSMSYDW